MCCLLLIPGDVLGLIDDQDVANADLDFVLSLVPIHDDASPPDLVDDRAIPRQDREREASVFVELEHQVEVRV